MAKIDSQQTELIGAAILTASLVADGIEIAQPARDDGVDLLAYDLNTSALVPIQLKASTRTAFTLDTKYAATPDLRLVYVWNVSDPGAAQIYCLTYVEAFSVAAEMGWTSTPTWSARGRYATTRPSATTHELLAPYRVAAGEWPARLGMP